MCVHGMQLQADRDGGVAVDDDRNGPEAHGRDGWPAHNTAADVNGMLAARLDDHDHATKVGDAGVQGHFQLLQVGVGGGVLVGDTKRQACTRCRRHCVLQHVLDKRYGRIDQRWSGGMKRDEDTQREGDEKCQSRQYLVPAHGICVGQT